MNRDEAGCFDVPLKSNFWYVKLAIAGTPGCFRFTEALQRQIIFQSLVVCGL